MSAENTFNKENLDFYLRELAKEYRKLNGKQIKAEIILVGGAAVLTNYGFREMTTDIDAVIRASSAIRSKKRIMLKKIKLNQQKRSSTDRRISYGLFHKEKSCIILFI